MPAGRGSDGGTTAVTPVALDRDVADVTPTSAIELRGPGSSAPITMPSSRGRDMVASLMLSPFVWSDDCLLHEPEAEVWVGVRMPATEVPARAVAIRGELLAAGAREVAAASHDDSALLAVHDAALVGFLRTAWDEWSSGRASRPTASFPTSSPGRSSRADVQPATPAAVWARPGLFAYDTMTLIGPGTWEAARAAVDVALTAVDLVVAGEPLAYACCRPPGHHVTRSLYGGSCYLNNTAIAATALLDACRRPCRRRRHRRTPRERDTGALPRPRRHPHRVGARRPGSRLVPTLPRLRERERRREPQRPARAREPATTAGSRPSREAAAFAAGARALVVALGVDAAAGDPESPLEVTADGYREAGRILGELGLPTVVVQEGGYDLATIGPLVVETLTGLAR